MTPSSLIMTMPSTQDNINSLNSLFGDKQLPSIASQSLDWVQRNGEVNILKIGLPRLLSVLYTEWQAAIKQVNSTNPPGLPDPEITAEKEWLRCHIALAGSSSKYETLPNFVNDLIKWYNTFGTRQIGSPADSVPTLPSVLQDYLDIIMDKELV